MTVNFQWSGANSMISNWPLLGQHWSQTSFQHCQHQDQQQNGSLRIQRSTMTTSSIEEADDCIKKSEFDNKVIKKEDNN